jgi:replicative DNA helicase
MVVATMKRGKSWFLCHLAKSALMQSKSVLYITLEMTKEEVEDRLDMMFGSLLVRPNEFKNIVQLPSYTCGDWHARKMCKLIGKSGTREDCYRCLHKREGFVEKEKKRFKTLESNKKVRKVLESANMFGGRLFIKEYSSRKMNVFTLEGLLDDLISFKDFYPEVILLDYADLMSSRKAHKEKRDSLDEIYKDLKDIAKERDCLVFTASQAIRSAIDKANPSQKDVAEDIRKFAHIDIGFMMGSTIAQRLEGLVNFICAAFRHGRQDWAVQLLQCYDIGQFCLDAIFKEMNPDEEVVFEGGENEN